MFAKNFCDLLTIMDWYCGAEESRRLTFAGAIFRMFSVCSNLNWTFDKLNCLHFSGVFDL